MKTMNLDAYALVVGFGGGLVAGAAFFGGLYATTRRLAEARHPAVLAIASFAGRILAVVIGAWLVARWAGVAGVLAYLVGVTVVRIALVSVMNRRDGVASPRDAVASLRDESEAV
jgi:F1F0 ATPase subunit 2